MSPSSILYPCDMNYFTMYSDIYHPESQKKSISRPGGFPGNDIDTVFSLRQRSHLPARHIIPHTSDINRQPPQAPRNFPLNASCIIGGYNYEVPRPCHRLLCGYKSRQQILGFTSQKKVESTSCPVNKGQLWALASDNQTAAKRRLSVPRAPSWLFLSLGTRGFGTLRCHIGSITVVKTPCWKDPEWRPQREKCRRTGNSTYSSSGATRGREEPLRRRWLLLNRERSQITTAVISHSVWGDLLLSKEVANILNGLQLELFPLLFFSAHTTDLLRTDSPSWQDSPSW